MKFGLKQQVIEQINDVFSAYPEVEQVIIYGSRAKDNFREGSDIDLTMQGDQLTENLRSKIYWHLDDLNTPYLFDLSIFDSLTNQELINNITQDGKIFYIKKKTKNE